MINFNGNNKISGKIIGLQRIDIKDYPRYSLREGLLNAVIHRSYYFDGSILVSFYDDRFEIVSLHGLIDGITIQDIFKGVSSSRNPNLANIFYRLGYVETFGTGIGRIMDSYGDYDKKPIFDTTDNAFSIILPNINYQREHNYIDANIIVKLNALLEKNVIKKENNERGTYYVLK